MAEPARIGVAEYFRKPESLRRMELVYGMVREPPAPRYGHQSVVARLTALLDTHVHAQGLGAVCVSPVDVVLDVDAALVVQPTSSSSRQHGWRSSAAGSGAHRISR